MIFESIKSALKVRKRPPFRDMATLKFIILAAVAVSYCENRVLLKLVTTYIGFGHDKKYQNMPYVYYSMQVMVL